jgi:hypothetical protein
MRYVWIAIGLVFLYIVTTITLVSMGAAQADPVPQQIPHPPVPKPCRDMKEILQVLQEKFGEVPIWYGTAGNGFTELLTSSGKTGTWTLQICAENQCCLQMSGTNGGLHNS